MDYTFLQHYWWAIISLLGALLVFLMFVQGGQSLLGEVTRGDMQRKMVVNSLGRKWEFTFTTLVTFGGAFFASFPLFYSTSFGGAYFVWLAILLVFVIQAVAYEYRSKVGNFLGQRTYDAFLMINGLAAPFLIGAAVGTFFTGANFTVDFSRIGLYGAGENIISQWESPWRGLEALGDARNWALGIAVLFLARMLGALYIINSVEDEKIVARCRGTVWISAPVFVVALVVFLISAVSGIFTEPLFLSILLVGVVFVLLGLYAALIKKRRCGIWGAGIGTVLAVFALLLYAGYTGSYYPSLVDSASSLTIENSSSSEFTLTVMSYVSLFIPFVVAYIWWAWRTMNKTRITSEEIESDSHSY
ncbi:MAG: cytochrome d ubiquinol oxidase subunit II [Rikenellaceae bacterium]